MAPIRIEQEFSAPPERVFALLADPVQRPRWQSSLARVELVGDPAPRLGQQWRDITKVPGVRPRMETIVFEPFRRWAERGAWGQVSARLELHFVAVASGTRVEAVVEVEGRGLGKAAAAAARLAAPGALAADLRQAASII